VVYSEIGRINKKFIHWKLNLTINSEKFSIAHTENTLIGAIEVQAGSNGLTRVDFLGHSTLQKANDQAEFSAFDPAHQALKQIQEYLLGQRLSFEIMIDWSIMKPFQVKVLKRTFEIPFGQVMTYGQLAAELGNPNASRAVGGALARNPIPIIIPCHRVVAADGRLTGFAAPEGIRTKQALLELEGQRIVGEKLV
jgi:methylated-DNA-[protein]-cysteine S-methyltransferase